MTKKRVFISFDYDHDEILKTFLVGQAALPDSPFELVDWSIKEALVGNWKEKARARIKNADMLLVICGEDPENELNIGSIHPREGGEVGRCLCRARS